MKRRLNGEGTVFEEADPRRRTTHRAEIDVRLPNGAVQRVIARGVGAADARAKLQWKVRRLSESHPDAERMSVVLEAWGWTEEKRDEETEYGELVNEEAWRTDTELAYFIAVNSPSDTPTAVFAAILEARGWPRDPYGIN